MKCRKAQKVKYSLESAKKVGRERKKRIYICPYCKSWHLTSLSIKEYTRKRILSLAAKAYINQNKEAS